MENLKKVTSNPKLNNQKKILTAPNVIVMTGCTGYLGSHLLRHLLKSGYIIYCLHRSKSNFDRVGDLISAVKLVNIETTDLNNFFRLHRVDYVLHCATNYGRKEDDPIQTIEANLILPLKLLHAAAVNGVCAFINTDTILDKGINNYSLSKKQFRDWLQDYSDRIVGINVALEHFYGPGDDSSKFVTYIIHSLLSNVVQIKLTEGRQKRDFIFIDDVVSAFMTIINKIPTFKHRYCSFEVGSSKAVEIREFVQLVKDACGNNQTNLIFGAIPYRQNEAMCSEVNISELRSLGWSPKVSLLEGIKKTITIERKVEFFL